MAALTADKKRVVLVPGIKMSIGASAGAVGYIGSMIALATDGYGVAASDTANLRVLGVCTKAFSNASGADGDVTIEYEAYPVELMDIASAAIAATDGMLLAVVADDNTLTDAATATNDIPAGVVLGMSGTKAIIRVGHVSVTNA